MREQLQSNFEDFKFLQTLFLSSVVRIIVFHGLAWVDFVLTLDLSQLNLTFSMIQLDLTFNLD